LPLRLPFLVDLVGLIPPMSGRERITH
jgi:hypothetical protein